VELAEKRGYSGPALTAQTRVAAEQRLQHRAAGGGGFPVFPATGFAVTPTPGPAFGEGDGTQMELDLDKLNRDFESKTATEILQWTYDRFDHDRIKVSTSFGAEGMVLVHMLVSMGIKPRVFTVDTGRMFQETYDVWDQAAERFGIEIESYSPDPGELRRLLAGKGPNLFYESVENRKACCHVRKVLPLKPALEGVDVWLAALRREQGDSRADMNIVAWSEQYHLYKICPLATWLEQNIWTYVRSNDVPYNNLYDQGFKTIGCAPCTRAVRMGEGVRSGRWWWEADEQKECGIHIEDGKVMRAKPARNFQI
jgi:phosphoadenosine phosphosulfate reductase